MARLIIDDEGRIWNESSLELRRRLHCPWLGDDFAPGVVRNLGYVSLLLRQSSAIVRFRPRIVSEVAIGELLHLLGEKGPERVLLAPTGGEHALREILTSEGAVARRVGEIMASETETDIFRSRQYDPGLLADDSPLGALLQLWRSCGDGFDWSSHADFLNTRLGGRFIVLSAESHQSDLRIEAAGSGLRVPGSNWFADNIGVPLAFMPDCFYRQRISQGYYATLRAGEPYAEEIEATIFWPRHELVHRKYNRLILRCPGRRGSTHLLGATYICA